MDKKNISRRNLIKAAVAAGFTVSLPFKSTAKYGSNNDQPNIILIMADDMGYECVGANGGTSYNTPVLDSLSQTGMRFEHCYSLPICTPSRVQIMTGLYSVRNYIRFAMLDPKVTTFAHLLRRAGYSTCVTGKWQLKGGINGPNHFGFDEYCLWQLTRYLPRYANPSLEINGRQVDFRNGEYGPDIVSDYGCEFIERNRHNPFLLYYPMILPHKPFEPTPDSSDWDPERREGVNHKGDTRYFSDMIAYTDKLVGKLIDKLESMGLREKTLVLFMADNGTAKPITSKFGGREIRGGKGTTVDAGTHVPLIANWPGVVPEHRVSQDLIDLSDFLPTLCGCAGINVPPALNIDGRSFMPQLRGERGDPRDWIYTWYSMHGGATGVEFARNHQYKLYSSGLFYDIANDRLEERPMVASEMNEHAKATRMMLQKALDQYKGVRSDRVIAQ